MAKKLVQKSIALLFAIVLLSSCGKQANDGVSVENVDDLQNYRTAVLLGSCHDISISKNENIDVRRFNSIPEIIAAVSSNNADCAIVDEMTLWSFDSKKSGLAYAEIDTLGFDIAAAFNKGDDPEIRESFNGFVCESKADGTLDEMLSRWTSSDIDTVSMPDIKLPKNGKPIEIGTMNDGMPFSFIKDNEWAGFEVELLYRWSAKTGRPIRLHALMFSSLIASLETHKIDMVVSNLTITEERAKKVDFSVPYYRGKTVCLYPDPDARTSVSFADWITDGIKDNLIAESRWKLIVDGLWETLVITLGALFFGTLLACLICYLRMSGNRLASGFARFYITFMRGIPILVFLMILFYVVFAKTGLSGRWIAIMAFSMNLAAYVGEIFRGGIESVDNGQWEAGWAMGFSKTSTFFHIIAPQTVKHIIPVYKGEAISLLKGTSIVGYIAIQDLTKASDIIRGRTFDAFFPLLVVTVIYFVLAWLIGIGLEKLCNSKN